MKGTPIKFTVAVELFGSLKLVSQEAKLEEIEQITLDSIVALILTPLAALALDKAGVIVKRLEHAP